MDWHQIFDYKDGQLYWSEAVKSKDVFGHYSKFSPVGSNANGYLQLTYKKKRYLAHCIIWYMHFGAVPTGFSVDHIDRNPKNNHIENLRLATQSQQCANTRKWSTSKTASRFKGLSAWRKAGKWRLFFLGQYHGLYASEVTAALKYNELSLAHFGEFACLNPLPQVLCNRTEVVS